MGWTEPRLLPPRWVSASPRRDHPPWGLAWCRESISLSGGQRMALVKFPPKCYFPDSFPSLSEGAAGWEEASLGTQGPSPPTRSQELGISSHPTPSSRSPAGMEAGDSRGPGIWGDWFLREELWCPPAYRRGPANASFPQLRVPLSLFESQSTLGSVSPITHKFRQPPTRRGSSPGGEAWGDSDTQEPGHLPPSPSLRLGLPEPALGN